MPARISGGNLTRWQLLALGLVALSCGAAWWYATRVSDRVVYLEPERGAHWIASPQPIALRPVRVPRDQPVRARFVHEFRASPPADRARLRLRAVREVELFWNGEAIPLPGRDPVRWKDGDEVDVTDRVVAGTNRLEAVVRNPEGPALLWLAVEGLSRPVATGTGWWIERGNERRPARIALDVGRAPREGLTPTPIEGLRGRALPLALGFLLLALPVWLLPREARARIERHAVPLATACIVVFWLALFAVKAVRLPTSVGFDVQGHFEYLRLLAEHRRLPDAADGWSTFHPPLYYVWTALLRGLTGATPGGTLDAILVHLLPMGAGLGSALAAGAIAVQLAPEDRRLAAASILIAGLLPVNVHLAVLVSNEAVNAGLASGVLLLACTLCAAPRAHAGGLAALSAACAAALLAKATSLPVVVAAVATVALKLWLVEGRTLGRSAAATGAVAAGIGVGAGWFYVRNALRFGNPFVTNYDLPDATYWLAPGFHTPDWYRGFGRALVHPFYASYAGFWDGLYSTFWGDGQGSGMLGIDHPSRLWDYDAMAAGYLLAVPASAALLAGFGVLALRAARGADLGRRLGYTLLWVTGFGMAFLVLLTTLRYPHYALPKAFYALPALAAYALALALGFEAVDRALRERELSLPGRALRGLLHGWAGALIAAWLMAYLGHGGPR